MWPVLPALLGCQRHRGTSHDKVSAVLASGCRVLASTSPALISAASVSCAVSSPEEGYFLSTWIRGLAAEHGLVATVMIGGGRLRATFARLDGVPEPSDGAG
jgi:hypothetical protein